MSDVINLHWQDGGTGITNFPPEDRPIYEAAILADGSGDLVLSETPFAGRYSPLPGHCSLHCVNPERLDLGPFWRIFDRIQADVRRGVEAIARGDVFPVRLEVPHA